mmetsp:Transcript_4882/g.17587  ORF Transcript_4882/g.17587 Transcript_4882/m.17587 type:complete len:229 (-) Transcript_4882:667-1353(-)
MVHLRGLREVPRLLQDRREVLEHVHLALVRGGVPWRAPLLLLRQVQGNLDSSLDVPKVNNAPRDAALADLHLAQHLLGRGLLGLALGIPGPGLVRARLHVIPPAAQGAPQAVVFRTKFRVNAVLEVPVLQTVPRTREGLARPPRQARVEEPDRDVVGAPGGLVLPPELQCAGVLLVDVGALQIRRRDLLGELERPLPVLQVHVHLQRGLGVARPEKVRLRDLNDATVP